jgi:hypothetical protein
MSDTDYEWPKYPTGPKDHVYALGVISLNFNLYEFSMIVLLERYFDKPVAEFIFDKLSTEERGSLIRRLVSTDPTHWYPKKLIISCVILRRVRGTATTSCTLGLSCPSTILWRSKSWPGTVLTRSLSFS